MSKFDASIPRRMYWNTDLKAPDVCPECRTPLEKEHHCYVLLLKDSDDVIPFLAGNDGGSFCPKCPVVVLGVDVFSRSAAIGAPEPKSLMVAGIVDIESIPGDKQHIPLGDDDNPIPLVKFLPSRTVGKRDVEKIEKTGRNDPCSCGSGKKYKKCCYGKFMT